MSVSSGRRATGDRGGILAITLAGFVLRLFRLGHQSLFIDEILSLESIEAPPGGTARILLENPQGPLHAALLLGWTRLFGTGEVALRLLSAIPGALSIPVFYLVARRLAPGRARLATAFFAFAPLHVWYSQETRGYALSLLFVLVAVLALLRSADAIPGPSMRHAGAMLLAALSNFTALLLWPAQALACRAWERGRRRGWLLATFGLAVIAAPWLYAEARHLGLAGSNPWPTGARAVEGTVRPGPGAVGYVAFALIYGTTLGPSLAELRGLPLGGLLRSNGPLLLVAFLAAAPLLVAGALRAARSGFRGAFVLAWLLVPFVAVIVLSLLRAKALTPRYLFVALPAAAFLLAWGVEALSARPRLGAIAGTAVFGLFAFSLGNYYFDSRYAREDFRGAARYLEREGSGQDRILLVGTWEPFRYYYHGPAAWRPLWQRDWTDSRSDLRSEILTTRLQGGRVFLVRARAWSVDPEEGTARLIEGVLGKGTRVDFPGVEVTRFGG